MKAENLRPAVRLTALGLFLGLASCQMLPDLPELPRTEGGKLTLTGRRILARARTAFDSDDKPTVDFTFDHAWYSCEGKQTAVFVLVKGDPENPEAAATCRVLWRPIAGHTPINDAAGNATLHILRFGPSSAEVWEGAGFVFLKDEPRHPTMIAQCWDADVVLKDASPGVKDTLGPATAEGEFTAAYDPEKVEALLSKLSRQTAARLGYPRLVQR